MKTYQRSFVTILLLLCLGTQDVNGFSVKPSSVASSKTLMMMTASNDANQSSLSSSRKDFLQQMAASSSSLLLIGAIMGGMEPANASGGATAGGAYLLSAKQRYNERVKGSVKGLLDAAEALGAGNSKPAKAYFASEEAGSWKDLTAAGYLLSNAFRRNSTAAPDSLPAVKKYKAFAATVDNLQKVLKKKGAEAAAAEFPTVEEALNVWLNEIELPNAREL